MNLSEWIEAHPEEWQRMKEDALRRVWAAIPPIRYVELTR